jgi:hypothetical protein
MFDDSLFNQLIKKYALLTENVDNNDLQKVIEFVFSLSSVFNMSKLVKTFDTLSEEQKFLYILSEIVYIKMKHDKFLLDVLKRKEEEFNIKVIGIGAQRVGIAVNDKVIKLNYKQNSQANDIELGHYKEMIDRNPDIKLILCPLLKTGKVYSKTYLEYPLCSPYQKTDFRELLLFAALDIIQDLNIHNFLNFGVGAVAVDCDKGYYKDQKYWDKFAENVKIIKEQPEYPTYLEYIKPFWG